MTSVPAVFVSSTCFDLRQLRVDLHHFLDNLGLAPVLSENNTFPVDPGVVAVENCLAVVKGKADIFVLIVGARHGSVTEQGRSVTNLEYLTARAKGIPIYVFVLRSVLEVLPLWKTNPGADFSQVVDSTQLFEFVVSLRETHQTWVFPFDTAQDISDVLRVQLAYLFKDALDLRLRACETGALSSSIAGVGGTALRIMIERPVAWEYLLFAHALDSEIRKLSDVKRDWRFGVAFGAGRVLQPAQFISWVLDKISEAIRMLAIGNRISNDALQVALGPSGVSGDAEAIVYVARRLAAFYRSALEWKTDFTRIEVVPELERVRTLASCLCDNFVPEIEEFSKALLEEIPRGIAAAKAGQRTEVCVTLKLTCPDQSEAEAETKRLVALIESGELPFQ